MGIYSTYNYTRDLLKLINMVGGIYIYMYDIYPAYNPWKLRNIEYIHIL